VWQVSSPIRTWQGSTESIIDAASLLQQPAIKAHYEILSLYGTNGLTEEHQRAILSLAHLQEIIFMLNADDAGKAAVQKHYHTLINLLPGVIITNVELPEGEDVNSMLQTHEDPKVLADLIEQRKRMKVTLKILHKDTTALPVWHSLDLYHHVQRGTADH
jgi:DNA primase